MIIENVCIDASCTFRYSAAPKFNKRAVAAIVKTHLYLARHGETQWNKVYRFQGQLDSNLTTRGEQQSQIIADNIKHNAIDLIASSPLPRALSSAKICQQTISVPLVNVPALMERDLGEWQGQYIKDIKRSHHYHEILNQFTTLAPPDGESAIECGTRIYKALSCLVEQNESKNILVIFHGEALRCFLAKLGWSSSDNAYQLFDNGCIIPITYQHDSKHFQHIM